MSSGRGATVGYGEAAPIPWFGSETVDETEPLAGIWVKRWTITAGRQCRRRLGCLRNALAAARSEVEGRVAKPFTAMERDKTNPHLLAVAALLPAGRAALAQIAAKAEAGFRVFKWKVGVGEMADELRCSTTFARRCRVGAKLRLDANGAWDRREAERWLERCADRPVEFVEQPCFVPPAELRMARPCRGGGRSPAWAGEDYPTPLALDESSSSDGDSGAVAGAGLAGRFRRQAFAAGRRESGLARLAKAKADVVFSSALETPSARGRPCAPLSPGRRKRKPRALGLRRVALVRESGGSTDPYTAPFLHWKDVERINPETVWTALS